MGYATLNIPQLDQTLVAMLHDIFYDKQAIAGN
jgi:hypothetical protein